MGIHEAAKARRSRCASVPACVSLPSRRHFTRRSGAAVCTLMPCLPVQTCHCQCGRCMLATAAHASVQVFGNDSVLGRGNETAESAQQWQDDVDMPVSLGAQDRSLDPDLRFQLAMLHSGCTGASAGPNLHPLCTTLSHVCQVGVTRQCLHCVCSLQRPSACPSTSPSCAADCRHHAAQACRPSMHANACQPGASCVCAGLVSSAHGGAASLIALSVGCLHPFVGACRPCTSVKLVASCCAGGSSPGRGRALPQELSHRDAGQAGLWSAHGRWRQQLRRA